MVSEMRSEGDFGLYSCSAASQMSMGPRPTTVADLFHLGVILHRQGQVLRNSDLVRRACNNPTQNRVSIAEIKKHLLLLWPVCLTSPSPGLHTKMACFLQWSSGRLGKGLKNRHNTPPGMSETETTYPF